MDPCHLTRSTGPTQNRRGGIEPTASEVLNWTALCCLPGLSVPSAIPAGLAAADARAIHHGKQGHSRCC